MFCLIIDLLHGMPLHFSNPPEPQTFDGQRALADVEMQVAFGPRTPGSDGHAQVQEWMRAELSAAGWELRIQSARCLGIRSKTSLPIAEMHIRKSSWVRTTTHAWLQTTIPIRPNGLNRCPAQTMAHQVWRFCWNWREYFPKTACPIWLVFFDAEDNGRIEGWDWILGSQAFVDELAFRPEAVVIVDMIGDADQNIYIERNSNPELVQEIWGIAAELGYEQSFIPEPKYSMLDDHTPFLQAGIPAVDIIDFDYPYWHTTDDTVDKVSAESLEAVGRTLQEWISPAPSEAP